MQGIRYDGFGSTAEVAEYGVKWQVVQLMELGAIGLLSPWLLAMAIRNGKASLHHWRVGS